MVSIVEVCRLGDFSISVVLFVGFFSWKDFSVGEFGSDRGVFVGRDRGGNDD